MTQGILFGLMVLAFATLVTAHLVLVATLTFAHRRLAAAGVESELHLFDGLPHAFFVWPDMPESTEAYGLIASFFDRHLGRRAR